ncbi:hypothetical protein NU195Hw_g196t1 [Hortaea werneckii]
MAGNPEMQTYAARLSSFQNPVQLSKRRASSQGSRRKNAHTVEWPHEQPSVEELARAGFFYRPVPDSPDNVQCFLCNVKLDGWEPEDDPVREHLAHSQPCAWALSLSVLRPEGTEMDPETRDPMSDEMVAARKGTFELGEGWCHEGKRGWRCKVNKMVESGWAFDPSPDTEDGVTCFYCNLSLDGWEPKDDPFEEHKRRSPGCAFFALVEQYHGAAGAKGKGAKKGRGRASSASRGSRMSTQSAMTDTSAMESIGGDLGESSVANDDSIMSTATTASQATSKGGRKKPGKKPSAKGGKSKKNVDNVEDEIAPNVQYPDLSQSQQDQIQQEDKEDSIAVIPPKEQAPPARASRKATRQSKQIDSSMLEGSQSEAAPKKRGRKPKEQTQPVSEKESRESEASQQLRDELENSFENEEMKPDHESTPHQAQATKSKRGTKRTSEGVKKEQDSSVPEEPSAAPPKAKGKKGRKPSKQPATSQEIEPEPEHDPEPEPEPQQISEPKDVSAIEYPWMESQEVSEIEPTKAKKGAKGKKGQAKKGKGKKASSTRSSRATVTEEDETGNDQAEDLERDEAEIEAELARIAAEQEAVSREQGQAEEYEPSPSHADRHADRIHHLEDELQHVTDGLPDPSEGMQNYIATVNDEPLPHSPEGKESEAPNQDKENATPSPSGSDKENQPSSHAQQSTAVKLQPMAPTLSPTKSSRIPLAPGTPNRSPAKHVQLSPSKLSPSKQFSRLSSVHPWNPIDLDAILMASPQQPTPGTLAGRLADVAGALTSPEKKLSVEEWVRWRAEKGEEELRRRCEEMVGSFEREGVRALESLGGIGTV